jgi:hypothetical protein
MKYGIDTDQLRVEIVRPVLQYIGLHSVTAENLVLGTALVESHGGFLRQVGGGPALGLWQMEPRTHDDIWENYLDFHPVLSSRVGELFTAAPLTADSLELIGNLYYGAAMCRVHYRRVPAALPDNSPHGLASYWKRYYNTPLGAGTVAKATPHFEVASNGSQE